VAAGLALQNIAAAAAIEIESKSRHSYRKQTIAVLRAGPLQYHISKCRSSKLLHTP
jgi:hypothetical protein